MAASNASWRKRSPSDKLKLNDSKYGGFNKYFSQLRSLVYRNTDEFYNQLGGLLRDINGLDFSDPDVCQSEEMVAMVLQLCCNLVPMRDEQLVSSFCALILNMVNKQKLVLINHVDIVTEYLLKTLTYHSTAVTIDIYRALGTVLYSNAGRTEKFHEKLLGRDGVLIHVTNTVSCEVSRAVVQCVENICIRSSDDEVFMSSVHQTTCAQILLSVLQRPNCTNSFDETVVHKTLINALKGIQNLLQASKTAFNEDLTGALLAALQAYMFFGLLNAPSTVPSSLDSLPLSDANFPSPIGGQKSQSSFDSPPPSNQKRSAKSKRNKSKKMANGAVEVEEEECDVTLKYGHLTVNDSGINVWAALASSESDFSDAERNTPSTPTSTPRVKRCSSARLRLHSLSCFNAFIKSAERRVVYSYWSSFIPDSADTDGSTAQKHTLFDVIMKDPSPKVRVAALSVLAVLLDGSKQFLMAAEESDQYRTAPFTSFSVVVCHMVKEMHRRLLLMMSTETSAFVITQSLKCLATLMANVPYQRLRPGLLSSAVKQIRPFLSHRDPNVRVACLTCLGSVVSTPSPLLEVCHIIEPSRPSYRSSEVAPSTVNSAESSCPLSSVLSPTMDADHRSPSILTPALSSGTQTPGVTSGLEADSSAPITSWLVRTCVRFATPQLLIDSDGSRQPASAQPLPVRLESLQLLALLTKGYFGLIRKSLVVLKELIKLCLADPEPAVQLHAAKLLDTTGNMLLQQQRIQPSSGDDSVIPSVDSAKMKNTVSDRQCSLQALELWQSVLCGSLPNALQHTQSPVIRSSLCDCLAAVGPDVFAQLPLSMRTLCVTLVLGLAADTDQHVRSAAVRALGCYVFYPSLREDVAFIADTSNMLIVAAAELTSTVRWRVAWSLGNLGDALVLNRSDANTEFMEDFSNMLLSKLFQTGIQMCNDSDKSRSNAVRAIGNFLRYLPPHVYASGRLTQDIDGAIKAVIKSITTGSVKVRWNGCYAAVHLFNNDVIYPQVVPRLPEIFNSLCSSARGSKNFKVRISAATAMAAPSTWDLYGSTEIFTSVWQCLIDVLQNLDSTEADFAEYKYRESLVEQVCTTFVHMVTLMKTSDLLHVGSSQSLKLDTLAIHLQKYFVSVAEDADGAHRGRANSITLANNRLKELSFEAGQTTDGKINRTLAQLFQLFSTPPPPPEDVAATGSGLTSGFRQMYD